MAVILLTDRRELGAPMQVVGRYDVLTTERMDMAKKFTREEAQNFIERMGHEKPYRNFLMTIDGD